MVARAPCSWATLVLDAPPGASVPRDDDLAPDVASASRTGSGDERSCLVRHQDSPEIMVERLMLHEVLRDHPGGDD